MTWETTIWFTVMRTMILNNQIWGIQHVQTKPPIFGFHIEKGCAIDSLRISGRHSESRSHHLLTFLPNLVGYIMYIEFLIWVGETLSSQIRILFQDLHNISRRYRHVFLSLTYPHLWHFQCLKSEKVGLYMCCLTQWIGFLGKILTGNHRFSHEIWGFPVNICPTKPIHCLTHSQTFRLHGFASQVLELFSQLSSLGWDLLVSSMTCYTLW